MTTTNRRDASRASTPVASRATSRTAAAAVLAALAGLHGLALADVHKCQGARGVVYSDGACPAGTQEVTYAPRALPKDLPQPGQDLPPTRAGTPAPAPAPAPAAHAGPVPDAPAPLWDTGLGVIEQMPGRSAWLDADTLAVTTWSEPKAKVPWMVRRIVAADARAHALAPLVPRGFLDCTNPEAGLVGIQEGDLESKFAVGGGGHGLPVQRFLRWDAAHHAVGPATGELASCWHAASCMKPAPADVASNEWWDGNRPVRYLQPQDGFIRWGMGLGPGGRPEGPSLQNGTRRTLLDATTSDIAKQVRPLPFRKSYQLSPGRYTSTTNAETPLVVMSREGRITRTLLPASLRALVDAQAPTAQVASIAVKPGLLVQVSAPSARGGGLYLAQGEQAKRVWCVAGGGPGETDCRITQDLEVSPDGCRVAFDARPAAAGALAPPTEHVLDLCAAAAASGGRAKSAR